MHRLATRISCGVALVIAGAIAPSALQAQAQAPAPAQAQAAAQAPTPAGDPFFAGLRWRNIGPNRGGRSITVAGSADRPLEYYFGATGGGLWKTVDGGTTWKPVTDKALETSSVGAVAVAP